MLKNFLQKQKKDRQRVELVEKLQRKRNIKMSTNEEIEERNEVYKVR